MILLPSGRTAPGAVHVARRGFHFPITMGRPRKTATADTDAALLPGLAEVSVDTGLEVLPSGAAELQPKELRFIVRLLAHGQLGRAAAEAGYSERTSAQMASELMTKPRVKAFYRRCLEQLGGTARAALARVEERTRVFHAKAIEAAQEAADLDALILTATTSGENGKNEYEPKRAMLERQAREYAKLALEGDRLLLTAAGKMGLEVKVSGGLDHTVTVTPEVCAALTRMREEALVK